MDKVLPGLLVICALAVLLYAMIRAESAARATLAQARLDLFKDGSKWADYTLKAYPHLLKWEKHPLYPDYLRIYRQEHVKAWLYVGKGAAICGILPGMRSV